MPTLKLKRNTVAGNSPTTAQLVVGELALNTEDGYLYAENAAGTVVNRIGTTSDRVGYLPAGTGSVATTVQAKLREFISPEDFGAVGDGVTDDTLAFQAAITYASGVSGSVYVPDGDYLFTAQESVLNNCAVAVYVPANVKIYGSGRVFCNKGALPTLIMFAIKGSNVVIDGLTIDNIFNNTGTNSQRSVAIEAGNRNYSNDEATVSNIDVLNCKLTNHFYGINFTTAAVSPNAIDGIRCIGNYIAAGNGIFSGTLNMIDASYTGQITNVIVSGNDCRNGTNSGGINLVGVHGFTVSGNTCSNLDYAGIQLENNCQRGVVSGNSVYQASRCLWVDDSRDIVLDGNVVVSESRVPPEGVAAYRDGILITREGFTGNTTYLTTDIVVSNNVVLDGRIRMTTFGSAAGEFGDFIITGNVVKFRNSGDQQANGMSLATCLSLIVSENTVIGGTENSILVSVGAARRLVLSNNITKKAGVEGSYGLYIMGDSSAEVVRVGNSFAQGIRGAVGTKVRGLEYLGTDGSPITFQNITIQAGTGSPEGVVTAGPGSIFLNKTEPAKLYIKASGFGNTGWVVNA